MHLVLVVNDQPHICEDINSTVEKMKVEMAIEFLTEGEVIESMFTLWTEGTMYCDMGLNEVRLEFWDPKDQIPISFTDGRDRWYEIVLDEGKNYSDPEMIEVFYQIAEVLRLTK